jgi:hypothetical protein
MILNQVQATAIYSAMVALKLVDAKIKVSFGDIATTGINVFQDSENRIHVVLIHHMDLVDEEIYTDMSEFSKVYETTYN